MAKKGTLAWWEDKVWKVMSEYVRMRDAWKFSKGDIGACVTCGRPDHWKAMQAGHFVSRKDKSTKYHEKNVHLQCPKCNAKHIGGGREWEHGQAIDRMYGSGTAEMLKSAAKQTCKRGVFDMELLYKYFTDKVKEQKKLRGVNII